jgi:hypothetical protein
MKYALIGLALVAAVLGVTLWQNQGSRLILEGSMRKVRIQKVDEMSTAAVVEVRINNPSDLPFEVKNLKLTLETSKGSVDGTLFRAKDLDGFFDFYKASLGVRFNDSLRIGERLKSRALVERTVGASFAVPEAELAGRRRLVLTLVAVDGAVPTVIAEKP